MHDTKKGKYTTEENEIIIDSINRGLKEGRKEREIIKELSERLNRGYSGIMSYVRKLRSEYPDRFYYSNNYEENKKLRLNSWEEAEEELVIKTVNEFSERGEPLSAAIAELEKKLSRTQGAIYQRIYSLRRKYPERFHHLPARRPRKQRKADWNRKRPIIRPLDEISIQNEVSKQESDHTVNQPLTPTLHPSLATHDQPSLYPSSNEPLSDEEQLVYQTFEKKYGRPNRKLKGKLIQLMRMYGCTKVSVALFTLTEDKSFPNLIIEILEQHLQNNKFL